MGIEYELKFRAEPQAQAKIRETVAGPWRRIDMETAYYDTPEGALAQRHCTLRRRMENGKSVCTLKTPAPDGARGEWETEDTSLHRAVPVLCGMGCPELLELLEKNSVVKVCGARFVRYAASVDIGTAVVELALDLGVLTGADRELPLCEVEVELKSGSRETAAAFAALLARKYDLLPETKSKFRRALDLAKEG